MRKLGFANRKNQWAYLLSTVIALSSVSFANAETMTLTFAGVAGQNGIAGKYHFQTTTNTATFNPTGSAVVDVWTFCISRGTTLNTTDVYNTRDDIHNLPTPGTAMGPVAAKKT